MGEVACPSESVCYISTHPSDDEINKGLEIPFFADQITTLTEYFDSKLADVGSSYFRNLEGTCAHQAVSDVIHH
jgi:hypothetical protein